MRIKLFILFLLMFCTACKIDKEEKVEHQQKYPENEMVFDKTKWETKDGEDYLYRDKMINGIVYNDTIRKLNKDEILMLLGEPDYIREGHLYYRINESRLGNWTLKTKTLVIKLAEDKAIEWIKIHE